MINNSQNLYEKRKDKNRLSEALAEVKTDWGDNINNSISNDFINSYNSAYSNAGGTGNGFNALGKKLAGLGNNGSNGFSTIGSAANNYITGSGNTGSAITSAINGTGSSGSPISSAINSNVNSGSGGFASKLGGGTSGGGTPWGLIGAVAKKGYNSISGHDDQDYSDTEESIVYPLQGASMGAQFGPWGAAGGALYGLGYSLKDDMGLKDSNFFTKLLFPIDMGGDYNDWISLA